MIRIRKPNTPPSSLRKKGPAANKRQCDHYARPSTEPPPEFEAAIYNDRAVRQALSEAQHGKCAYCECKLTRMDGDVEHFRPKAAVHQEREEQPLTPGYYWLAYEWSNLLLTCQHCNQIRSRKDARRGKGNLFPLANPALRARSPADALEREQPLLINPSTEDPTPHLTFERECVRALSERGAACITILGLDHPALEERRRDHFQRLEALRLSLGELQNRGERHLATRIRELLAASCKDSAEFAAMARSAPDQNTSPPLPKKRSKAHPLSPNLPMPR